jgi:hypothetical protein
MCGCLFLLHDSVYIFYLKFLFSQFLVPVPVTAADRALAIAEIYVGELWHI